MKRLYFFLFLPFFACQAPDSDLNETEEETQASFVPTDSVEIKDILVTSFLFQTKDEENLVFKDPGASKVFVFDLEGNLIEEFEKSGDVPGNFSLVSTNFVQDKSNNLLTVDLMGGVKGFSKSGEVFVTMPLNAYQFSFGDRINFFRSSQVVEMGGKEFFVYRLDINDANSSTEYNADFLRKRKSLILADLETEEQKLILPFSPESRFLNGQVYPFAYFRPIFYIDEDENELHVIFTNDRVLYTYDWNSGEPKLKDSKELNLENHELAPGYEVGTLGKGQISMRNPTVLYSSIESLEKVGENFLISYRPMPTSKDLMAKALEGTASKDELSEMNKERRTRTVVLTKDGELIPVATPEMHYDSYRVVGDEIFWMKKPDPNQEAEDFTLY